MINKCGSGTPKFLHQKGEEGITEGRVVTGPLLGGVAWLDGHGACTTSGVNCPAIGFTLINPGASDTNAISSVNYSLLEPVILGNHTLSVTFPLLLGLWLMEDQYVCVSH